MFDKFLHSYIENSQNKEGMITLPFHFDFPAIKMKDGRFEGHVRNTINYKEEDAGLFKQWMRKGKGYLAEFEVFQSIQRTFYDQKCLLTCGFQEEKLLTILKEEISLEKSQREKDLLSQKKKVLDLTLSERVNEIIILTIEDFHCFFS